MDLTYIKVYITLIFKTTYIHVLIHVLVILYGLYAAGIDIA